MPFTPIASSSPQQITQLWQPLAEKGHTRAQYVLGRVYFDGKYDKRNLNKAAYWFSRSAAKGDVDAQYFLGVMFIKGWGVSKSEIKGAHWFRLAAEQGLVKAQYYLSRMYAKGMGLPTSYVYAYMWALLAATGGKRNGATSASQIEKIRAIALDSLESYTCRMSREEASAAIRMAKRWRERN